MLPGMALAAIAAALLVPAAALAQPHEDGGHWGQAGHGAAHAELEPPAEGPDPGEAALLAAMATAHVNLTEIMHAHVAGDYSAPDYPFVMSYVDEANLELVVMMHVMAALAGIQYGEEELRVALGIENPEVDIKIVYGTFTPDASWVRVESWRQYYLDNCVPEPQPARMGVCALHAERLRDAGAGAPGPAGAAIERIAATAPPAAQPVARAAPAATLRGGMSLAEWLPAPQAGHRGPVAGTTGIVVDYGGEPAMVVSSHVIDGIGEGAVQPVRLELRGGGNGVRADSEVLATTDILSVTAVSSDAAVVRLSGTNMAHATGEIQNGTSAVAISAHGGARGLLGEDAEIIGAMTRDRGPIITDTVSIRAHVAGHDRVITKQAIAAYSATRGDSGAPIVHTDAGGRHALLGIHLGTIQTLLVEADGRIVPWPGLGANSYAGEYGVFSTWENVRRDLGIP